MLMANGSSEGKRRLNAFDIVLIVVLVGLLVFLTVWALKTLPTGSSTGDTFVSYVIAVSDLPEGIGDQVTEGQALYDFESGVYIGEVTAVSIDKHIETAVNQYTGDTVANTVNGRYDIRITVRGYSKYDGASYKINGLLISCGEQYSIRTSGVVLNGSCISLTTH